MLLTYQSGMHSIVFQRKSLRVRQTVYYIYGIKIKCLKNEICEKNAKSTKKKIIKKKWKGKMEIIVEKNSSTQNTKEKKNLQEKKRRKITNHHVYVNFMFIIIFIFLFFFHLLSFLNFSSVGACTSPCTNIVLRVYVFFMCIWR